MRQSNDSGGMEGFSYVDERRKDGLACADFSYGDLQLSLVLVIW
jgi:hypothetical protein